jgi:hypothetical protein
LNKFSVRLQTTVDDFLLAKDKSLGKGKVAITEVEPGFER